MKEKDENLNLGTFKLLHERVYNSTSTLPSFLLDLLHRQGSLLHSLPRLFSWQIPLRLPVAAASSSFSKSSFSFSPSSLMVHHLIIKLKFFLEY